MTQREKNVFDKIGDLIPGYRGYVIREEMRSTDKRLRSELASLIEFTQGQIEIHQQDLINKNDMKACHEWEVSRKNLNTLCSKIKNATYGESSFFSNSQLKEKELDKIYQFDFVLTERVKLIETIVTKEFKEAESNLSINRQVQEIEKILSKRTDFINTYK